MERYEVFYRETLIGVLTVDLSNHTHHYMPEPTGTAEVLTRTSLPMEMRSETPYSGPPIPFLENRLKNMRRAGLKELNYQTDYFLIRACP